MVVGDTMASSEVAAWADRNQDRLGDLVALVAVARELARKHELSSMSAQYRNNHKRR